MQTKPLASDLQVAAILTGLIINIFVAGVGWGTLWTKVGNLEKRLDRIENRADNVKPRSSSEPWDNSWINIPPKAYAETRDTTSRDSSTTR